MSNLNMSTHFSLKSFFGGMFKNKFSRLPKEKSTCGDKQVIVIENSKNKFQTSTFSSSKSADQLSKIVNRSNGDNSPTLVDKPKSTTSTSCGPSLSESSRAQIQGTRWEAMDNQIDQNLGIFCFYFKTNSVFHGIPFYR